MFSTLHILFLSIISCLLMGGCSPPKPAPLCPTSDLIAHAGGGIANATYTNSLEALNESYREGYCLIELDFEWTKDKHLVVQHDWSTPSSTSQNPPTLAEFKKSRTIGGHTPLTAEDLLVWLRTHPEIFVVTDVKQKNIEGLTWLKEREPNFATRFIPQIYAFKEYDPVKKLGAERVILTLYRSTAKDPDIIYFAKKHPLFAVTIPFNRPTSTLPGDLKKLGVPTYTHTINSETELPALHKHGYFGVYTDFILPAIAFRR